MKELKHIFYNQNNHRKQSTWIPTDLRVRVSFNYWKILFLMYNIFVTSKFSLNPLSTIPQNGQTPSNKSSAFAGELFECV